MTTTEAQATLDKIMQRITGAPNSFSLEQFQKKYAFDVSLPLQVQDVTTGEATWTQAVNASKFMTLGNIKAQAIATNWEQPKRPLKSIEDMLQAWEVVNYIATERQIESLNVAQSDNVYFSENVFRSQDVIRGKNILFSESVTECEYVVAGQRSFRSVYCARVEDSANCSNSFSVSWSNNVVNSLFVLDSSNLYECMFCASIKDKKFCIANMQFTEAEYWPLKAMVLQWLLEP
ncbi:MAG TPA: hypothetical protein VLF69_06425 [Candidatus Saccharimonadales bacterium]|nr:hypothetical protein [Candidatus Saccharimonadales bacterium]